MMDRYRAWRLLQCIISWIKRENKTNTWIQQFMCVQETANLLMSPSYLGRPNCMEDSDNFLQSNPSFMHWQTQYILWFYWIYKLAIGIIAERARRKLLYSAYKLSLYISPCVHRSLLIVFIVHSTVINFNIHFLISEMISFSFPCLFSSTPVFFFVSFSSSHSPLLFLLLISLFSCLLLVLSPRLFLSDNILLCYFYSSLIFLLPTFLNSFPHLSFSIYLEHWNSFLILGTYI